MSLIGISGPMICKTKKRVETHAMAQCSYVLTKRFSLYPKFSRPNYNINQNVVHWVAWIYLKAEDNSLFCAFQYLQQHSMFPSNISKHLSRFEEFWKEMYAWGHFVVYYVPASEVLTCFIVGLRGILANNGIFKWSNKNNKKAFLHCKPFLSMNFLAFCKCKYT